ncbi:hypothetical protein AGOR_G00235300 [Albula goreensis]|uniref:Uncharacterized protein n=1 Tax=Albula goreensis TaxID=1534307 RepID=A0A8T3CML3_9TELE|nr:hypothetical protein AGOR_G00235300 [Albula goreensis]
MDCLDHCACVEQNRKHIEAIEFKIIRMKGEITSLGEGKCSSCARPEEKLQRERSKHLCRGCEELQDKLQRKQQELDKFKAKMKIEISGEMENSGCLSENINNPLRETALIDIYGRLKTQVYGKTRDDLWKKELDPKTISENLSVLVKDIFKATSADMKNRKNTIEEFICHKTLCGEDMPTAVKKKVSESVQAALQSLQMALSHLSTDAYKEVVMGLDTMKKIMMEYEEDTSKPYIDFAIECYKVSCLLALHNPPLTPSWDLTEEQLSSVSASSYDQVDVILPMLISNGTTIVSPPVLSRKK